MRGPHSYKVNGFPVSNEEFKRMSFNNGDFIEWVHGEVSKPLTDDSKDMPREIYAHVENVDGLQFYNHWHYEGEDADDPNRKATKPTRYIRADLSPNASPQAKPGTFTFNHPEESVEQLLKRHHEWMMDNNAPYKNSMLCSKTMTALVKPQEER